ncbi:paired amphipathic helix protein Sin3-like 2 isoform X2 [Rosa rugosa]|uniref:paired amphipathic helix protein Sin3-like 2 isoform X2 n=1 Tax=Rosa rugosa TaxID=74645 RepID=UPI002B4089A4|nr:paired amphipathic helix protein Sin3-like 2 isoform X2 [Rosa rugosa]
MYFGDYVVASVGVGASQKLPMNDALTYIKEVEDAFQDQREKYNMFLEILKDFPFKPQRTDMVGVIARVRELFKGHTKLLLGFNTFLPKGFEITLEEVEPIKTASQKLSMNDARTYIKEVEDTFQNQREKYNMFLEVLKDFLLKPQRNDLVGVIARVRELFKGHTKLLLGFNTFLPKGFEITLEEVEPIKTASQKLSMNDARTYIKEVEDTFQDQREKYNMFLEVLKDFLLKPERNDMVGVIARVMELFKGHTKLLLGFNTFLPKGLEIIVRKVEPIRTVKSGQAISFLNKMKKRFQNDERVYKSFVNIVNMYVKEHKDVNEVYQEVASLFDDQPDLLDEFTGFLPPDMSATTSTNQGQYGCIAYLCFNKQSSAIPTPMPIGTQHRLDKITSHGDHDISVDRPELDDDNGMMKVLKEQRKRFSEMENRDRRNHDHEDRELETDNNRDYNLQRFPEKIKSSRNVEGFGLNANFTPNDDKDTLKSKYSQEFGFCEKVNERLCSQDDYQEFLKCLRSYSNGIITRNDLQNLVTDLLGKYPDLMEEFNDSLERCENIESLSSDGHVLRSVKDKEPKRKMEGVKEKERYRGKYWTKSIQELDLSNCERSTPSYRLLPEDYPIPSASLRSELAAQVLNDHWVSVKSGLPEDYPIPSESQRSEVAAQVLNDHWVSVTSRSEDNSVKHKRRNQYEESLCRCEDDRFELDMLLESMSSTSKRAEELSNSMNENKLSMETQIHIEDHFTAQNLRCIERLYGDHGLNVVDILRKSPTTALPVILTRLKQKQEEWTRCRADFNKVWADIYAKNHDKSLDHCA